MVFPLLMLPTEAQTLSGNNPQGQLFGQLNSGPTAILTDGHQVLSSHKTILVHLV